MKKDNLRFSLLIMLALAVSVGPAALASTSLTNPIGYTTVEDVGLKVLDFLRGIVGVLSVIFIVIGGILYITSAGDSGRTEMAKKAITGAVIGLALALAGPSFVRTIYEDILESTLAVPEEAISMTEIAMNVLEFLLGIAGTLAVLTLVYGGITYFTAAVDTKQAETAKKIIIYSVIGITVILLSLSMVKWVGDALGTT